MNPISDVSWSYTPTQTFQHWLHLAQIERVLSEVKWTSCSKCCMITLTWRVSRGQDQNDRKQNGGDKSRGRWEWVQQAQVEKLLSLPRWALQNSADGNLTVWGFPKNHHICKVMGPQSTRNSVLWLFLFILHSCWKSPLFPSYKSHLQRPKRNRINHLPNNGAAQVWLWEPICPALRRHTSHLATRDTSGHFLPNACFGRTRASLTDIQREPSLQPVPANTKVFERNILNRTVLCGRKGKKKASGAQLESGEVRSHA